MGRALSSTAEANVIRNPVFDARIITGSIWGVELVRNGNIIEVETVHNICTTEGIDFMNNVMFHGTAAVATWYIALFESDYTPVATNTYAAPGYAESSAYTEATRQAFVEAASTARVVTNAASKAVFNINATKTLYGASLVSVNTKGDVAGGGVLFCSSRFSSSKPVVSGDVLNITITITTSDA